MRSRFGDSLSNNLDKIEVSDVLPPCCCGASGSHWKVNKTGGSWESRLPRRTQWSIYETPRLVPSTLTWALLDRPRRLLWRNAWARDDYFVSRGRSDVMHFLLSCNCYVGDGYSPSLPPYHVSLYTIMTFNSDNGRSLDFLKVFTVNLHR